jgi:hypothetical protein
MKKLKKEITMTKAITKKAKRAAKKLFASKPHSTRAFTSEDYLALPKGEDKENK